MTTVMAAEGSLQFLERANPINAFRVPFLDEKRCNE